MPGGLVEKVIQTSISTDTGTVVCASEQETVLINQPVGCKTRKAGK